MYPLTLYVINDFVLERAFLVWDDSKTPLNAPIVFNYDTFCMSCLYKVQPLEKLGQYFKPMSLTSKALLKSLALETLVVF